MAENVNQKVTKDDAIARDSLKGKQIKNDDKQLIDDLENVIRELEGKKSQIDSAQPKSS
jgi:hypothetical protein